nr:reverse transcriptase domain-containing protein [Tanacetum cinerariifolium]
MVTPVENRSSNKFCDFHNDKGHSTDECMQLKKQIEELVRAGKLSHLIKEIKHGRDQSKTGKKETTAKDKPTAIYMIQSWKRTTRLNVTQSFERVKEITFPPLAASSETEGPLVIEAEMGGHMIHLMYVDVGSSIEVLYEHCFNRLWHEIKSQMVPAITSLTGFSGETIWPLGQLRLLVIIGHSTKAWMNFMIVRSLSPYKVEGGIATIRSTVLIPTECTSEITSSAEEKTRPANFKVALHPDFLDQKVVIRGTLSDKGRTELCSILKKNLDIFAWKPSDVTAVPRGPKPGGCRDNERGLIPRLAVQPSHAKHQLNIREGYSPVRQKKRGQAPECAKAIQAEVQKLVDAGIMRELAEPDEEKATFHIGQGVYCYTKIPFGLKNAGATYQRLMDKTFESQIDRNIEMYVDDLVVKSYKAAEMMKDIDETFHTLRKVNMKLNLKKCSFGLAEGMFLGYVVTPEGIKPKVFAAIPNLEKCIKKSDFYWTAKAEQAFKQLKQHLSELPLLVAPKPKEELIIYLSVTYEAISAILMTERGTVQTSIYFISRTLQGPELNYTPMEKLVLSLVFAAKRIQRYYQAHPITVITDQPIKQIMSRLDVAGRLQKWSIMLGEHNIRAYTDKPGGNRIYLSRMGVENIHVSVNSKLIANQVLGTYVAKEDNMVKFLEIVKSLLRALVQIGTGRSTQRQVHKREGGGNNDKGGRTDLDDTDSRLFKRRNSPWRQE